MTTTLIAFDLETSGAYPLGAEIVEFAAVKWRDGSIVDKYQTLLKPSIPMSDFNISIHGITNEMVAHAPVVKEKIKEIADFISDGLPLAHHAAFDMGFLAIEFEKYHVPFPTSKVLCTSLLARSLVTGVPNHKLQTLIRFLGIQQGTAHRALDDSQACLEVGLHCLTKEGALEDPYRIFSQVKCSYQWSDFKVLSSTDDTVQTLIKAIQEKLSVNLIYTSNESQEQRRRINPVGLVRTPEGDFVQAQCLRDHSFKRFYLKKMKNIQLD